MKFLRHEGERLCYELRRSDRDVFHWLLDLYPVMPSGHIQITRTTELDADGERQQLLEEALADRRQENKGRIQSFLHSGQRFEPHDLHFILRLTEADGDWLLEVLNEIRVGSWVRLGRPPQGAEVNLPLHPESLRHLWAMELSAYLETRLLDGLTALP